MQALVTWFKTLAPRERWLVGVAATLVSLLVLYFGVLHPLHAAVQARQSRVDRKQQDLVWMRSTANTVRMLAATHPNVVNGESLVVLINRTAQQTGLASALVNQSPAGDSSVRVRLENAAFDSMVAWFATLEQQYGVRVESASIDRTDKLGAVNASIVLTRAARE